MTTATRTIQRGDVTIVVTSTRNLSERVINADGDKINTGKIDLYSSDIITMSKAGKQIASGELEVFTDAYKASPSFSRSFSKFPAPPAGRIGDGFVSQEAVVQILGALAETAAEVDTPAVLTHRAITIAASAISRLESARYEAHAKAVENMMTLNGRSY